MAQAEANRRKPPMNSLAMAGSFGGAGGAGGGGMMMVSAPGGGMQAGAAGGAGAGGGFAPGAAAGGAAGETGSAAGGAGRRGMFFGGPGGAAGGGGGAAGSLSEEDRTKMRAAMQKALNGRSMQDLTQEERQKVFEEVRKAVPAMAAMQRSGAQAGRAGGSGAGAEGGPGGGRQGPGGMGPAGGGAGGFSQRELEAAKLPPPVDPENQLEVLLRPGLLADVEIILEKIPDAINVPSQAVFEKDGKLIVYVRKGSSWEERPIKPLKRSESVMVVAGGVTPGETIAMADPNAAPGDKKKSEKSKGGAVGSLPGGGRS
jgi:hypothetical protein